MAITKRKRPTPKIKYVFCPACGKGHTPNPLYGMFCCLSCLQLLIRPLILARPGDPRIK